MKAYRDSSLLKWALVLSLCTASSLSQSIFNDDDLFAESEGQLGIIDISQNGRTDVSTNLNLSPWELFVLNDLVFKVTAKKCDKLNEDVLSSFKQMLADSFKQAPMVEIQNSEFLPSYSHLVRCLDHVYEKSPDTTTPANHQTNKVGDALVELEEATSEEGDWAAQDAISSTTTTSTTMAPKKRSGGDGEDALASTWLWGFRSVHQWLREMLKESPKVVRAEEKEEREIGKERQVEMHQRRIEVAYRRARQNFANYFHEMWKVVRKTCPVIHRPDRVFMRKAFLDMAAWATLEQRATIAATAKYFRKHELLKLLQECSKAL